MINKYAEIRDRLVLYNACKGVLRVKQAKTYNYSPTYTPNNTKSKLVGSLAGGTIGLAGTLFNNMGTAGLAASDDPISTAIAGVPFAASHIINGSLGGIGSAALAKKLGLSKEWQNRIGGIGLIANPAIQQIASLTEPGAATVGAALLNATLGGLTGYELTPDANDVHNYKYRPRF